MTVYKINTPSVVSETIDGEVIAIQLDLGTYYSLRGSAVVIWEMIRDGVDVDAIAASLERTYADARIGEMVRAFAGRLRDEGLIVLRGSDPNPETPPAVPDVRPHAAAFEPPDFERHTDMREFLLVDPIHEVDVTEWPQPKPRTPIE